MKEIPARLKKARGNSKREACSNNGLIRPDVRHNLQVVYFIKKLHGVIYYDSAYTLLLLIKRVFLSKIKIVLSFHILCTFV